MAICSASSSAAGMSAAGSCSPVTSPHRSACSAPYIAPLSSISLALPSPMTRGSRHQLRIRPTLTPAQANRASTEARRTSQHRATSSPPPTVYPLIAAITGKRAASIRVMMLLRPSFESAYFSKSAGVSSSWWRRFAPERNDFPVPVTTRQRMLRSRSNSSNAAMNARHSARPKAFLGGLSMRSTPTCSVGRVATTRGGSGSVTSATAVISERPP